MSGHTVSGTVPHEITVGGTGYQSPLTITANGFVNSSGTLGVLAANYGSAAVLINFGTITQTGPSAAGDGAVEMATSGSVDNAGIITGAGFGIGIVSAGVTITNTDVIRGYDGIYDATTPAFITNSATIEGTSTIADAGGYGIRLESGGSVTNSVHGLIYAAAANTGIFISGGSATLVNDGTVIGGTGTNSSGFFGGGGYGGVALTTVSGDSDTATNSGLISGGVGGTATVLPGGGGYGVFLGSGAALTNQSNGTIAGGTGGYDPSGSSATQGTGGDGAQLTGGTLVNNGKVAGGNGPLVKSLGPRGYGGTGVELLSGMLTNTGTITGGSGDGFNGSDAGVYAAAGATLVNSGAIIGGNALIGTGGSGILLQGGSTLTIGGVVTGGSGDGGSGGSGVDLEGAGSLDNAGTVTGGVNAGSGFHLADGGMLTNTATIAGGAGLDDGGDGGIGANLADGGTLVNDAVITGGQGGIWTGSREAGGGGDGVDLTTGTLFNNTNDAISGGAGGFGAAEGGNGGYGVGLAGGTLGNAGTILGGDGGDSGGAGPSNYGGNGGAGVSLTDGTTVTNTGTIGGGSGGYGLFGEDGGAGILMGSTASATVVASGKVFAGSGQYVAPGGSATLLQFGIVGGAGASVGDGDALTNIGTIIGGAGVVIGAGGTFTVLQHGHVTGGAGVSVATGGTLVNSGSIISGVGIDVSAGGVVVNGGSISGGVYGGVTADAVLFGSALGTLLVDPGAHFVGNVVANAAFSDALVLASATTAGTITGLGSQFLNFSYLTVASGASWIFSGSNALGGGALDVEGGAQVTAPSDVSGASRIEIAADADDTGAVTINGAGAVLSGSTLDVGGTDTAAGGTGTLTISNGGVVSVSDAVVWSTSSIDLLGGTLDTDPVTISGGDISGFGTVTGDVLDDGTITASGGLLDLTGNVTGTGPIAIGGDATLALGGSLASSITITFDAGADQALQLGDPVDMKGTIDGFVSGDTLDLTTVTFDPAGQANLLGDHKLQIVENATTYDLQLSPSQDFNGDYFHLASDGSDGTAITENTTPCYCRGTFIRTDRGEVPVEALTVGNRVVTLSGETRKIVWIGTGRRLVTRGRRCAATPIKVCRGALADNVPYRDLCITKGHSLHLDGVLVPAEFLVNHRSILWDDHAQVVEYYHIELATHDVLVANGAPAESYRDDGNRWLFQNANSGWDQPTPPPCAPVLTGGPVVDAIWWRLVGRAGPRPGIPLTEDPDLHLLVDGERIDAASRHGSVQIFALPGHPTCVRVASRAGVPAELGVARDARSLGIALRRIVLRQGTRFRVLEVADPVLAAGFHAFEADGDLRWTDGDASLPAALFDGFAGPVELVLHIACTTQYPLLGEPVRAAAA